MIKTIKVITGTLLAASLFGGALASLAAEKKADAKVKPYTLNYCVVSGDKLGEMGKPFVFTNDTQEIKFCCKGCLKDFKKDPAKYLKKIQEGEAKEAKHAAK